MNFFERLAALYRRNSEASFFGCCHKKKINKRKPSLVIITVEGCQEVKMLLSFLTIYTHTKKRPAILFFFCAAVSRWKTEAGRTTTTSHTHKKKEELLKCLHSQGGARNLPCKSSTDKLLAICERINQHLFFFF